jgi:hypothetical protein
VGPRNTGDILKNKMETGKGGQGVPENAEGELSTRSQRTGKGSGSGGGGKGGGKIREWVDCSRGPGGRSSVSQRAGGKG